MRGKKNQPRTKTGFVKQLERNQLSPITIENYAILEHCFLKECTKINEQLEPELQDNLILDFMDKHNYIASRSFLKKYLTYIDKKRMIDSIPKIKGKSNKLPKYINEKQVREMIEQSKRPKIKILIQLLYECGLRVSEALNIKRKDINLEDNTIRIVGKGHKEAIIHFGTNIKDKLIELISQVKDPEKDTLFKMNRFMAYKYIKEAGLKCENKPLVSPHMIRHTTATELLRKGVNLLTIKEVLRHVSIDTTTIYTRIEQPEVVAALELIQKKGVDLNGSIENRRVINKEIKIEEVGVSDNSGDKKNEGLVEGEGLQSKKLVLPDLYRLWF